MLRTPSIFGPLSSGFVPFSSAAPGDTLDEVDAAESAHAEAAEVVARAAAAPSIAPVELAPRAVWAPASAARIRLVEAAVAAAICAYFGYGLLRALAGL
jgi:hypothetical protein